MKSFDWTQKYCSRAVIPHGCLYLLVKPAEMDYFIYFVAERPHKALRGTLQPPFRLGTHKNTKFGCHIFNEGKHLIWANIQLRAFGSLWIYVCKYSVWVVYLLFIRVMYQCSTVNVAILVSTKPFPASKSCMSTHSISSLSVNPGRDNWLSPCTCTHPHAHSDIQLQCTHTYTQAL